MARKTHPLTKERELELGRLALAGDESARAEIVEANLWIVQAIVGQLIRKSRSSSIVTEDRREDMEQEGMVGLLIAAKRYDPAFDCRFSTIATYYVKWKARAELLRIQDDLDVQSLDEVADPPSGPAESEPAGYNPVRSPRHALIEDPTAEQPAAECLSSELRARVASALARLPLAQRRMVAAVHGFRSRGRGPVSFHAAARLCGLTLAKARELLAEGEASLRGMLEP